MSILILILIATLVYIYKYRPPILELPKFHMSSLYKQAKRGLGYSTFDLDELNEDEKGRVEKFEKTHVGGLYNEGNTCFMNSVIQSLASLTPVVDFIKENKKPQTFSDFLFDTIQHLNQIKSQTHNYSTQKLVSEIEGSERWLMYNQEDAQEFFHELLNTLEKDADLKSKLKTSFDGKGAQRVGCTECGYMEGIKERVLSSLDLSLNMNYQVTLNELLKDYTKMEEIDGVECYKCSLIHLKQKLELKLNDFVGNEKLQQAFLSRINEVENLLKMEIIDEKQYQKIKIDNEKIKTLKTTQLMLAKPNPQTLMIHINRSIFNQKYGTIMKNTANVLFPVKLDLGEFTCDPQNSVNFDPKVPMSGLKVNEIYNLKAAVVHYGSATFGHYICFRKFQNLWWRISDDNVELTTESQVLKAQGVFMLFYERENVLASIAGVNEQ